MGCRSEKKPLSQLVQKRKDPSSCRACRNPNITSTTPNLDRRPDQTDSEPHLLLSFHHRILYKVDHLNLIILPFHYDNGRSRTTNIRTDRRLADAHPRARTTARRGPAAPRSQWLRLRIRCPTTSAGATTTARRAEATRRAAEPAAGAVDGGDGGQRRCREEEE